MAANTNAAVQHLAWYNKQEFVDARNSVIPQGGRTRYVKKRRVGLHSPTDVTAFHWGQRTWCKRDMPEILYQLKRTPQWEAFKRAASPLDKRDAQGNVVYEQWPEPGQDARPLLDFEVLPDQIGSAEYWFIMEAWRRLDPRINWVDIQMRIEPSDRPTLDNLRSRNSRKKQLYHMISWWTNPTAPGNQPVIQSLTQAQIAGNTTRGSTPGLIDPALGEAGGRIPHPIDEGNSEEDDTDDDSPADDGDPPEDGSSGGGSSGGGKDETPEPGHNDIIEKGVAISPGGTLRHPGTRIEFNKGHIFE